MNIFSTLLWALVAVAAGKHGKHIKTAHEMIESIEPQMPKLNEKQTAAMAKFENKEIFRQVWADARTKVHKRMQVLRERNTPLHKRLHHRRAAVQDEDMAFE